MKTGTTSKNHKVPSEWNPDGIDSGLIYNCRIQKRGDSIIIDSLINEDTPDEKWIEVFLDGKELHELTNLADEVINQKN